MKHLRSRFVPRFLRRLRKRSPHGTPRIGLFGIFGAGNAGNDGSLEAMLLFLRGARPEHELVCICTRPSHVHRSFGVRAVPIGLQRIGSPRRGAGLGLVVRICGEMRNLKRAFLICRTLNFLIFPGTGILDDFGERPFGVPMALLGWSLAAWLAGAKISFVSVGAGPIHISLSRILMKRAMRLADYRSCRDVSSKKFIKSIGLKADDDPIFPDLVFDLPAPPSNHQPFKEMVVGIGIMNYRGWRNDPIKGDGIYRTYIDKIAAFTAWILERGYSVRLLTGDLHDQTAVRDMLASLASMRENHSPDSIVTEPISSLHDLMREIAMTDFVVASRFHNIVCSLKLGRPAISIGYSSKNDDLMKDVGLGEYCQSIEALDVETLKSQFLSLEAKNEFLRASLSTMNRVYQNRLNIQKAILLSRFPGGQQSGAARAESSPVRVPHLRLVKFEPGLDETPTRLDS